MRKKGRLFRDDPPMVRRSSPLAAKVQLLAEKYYRFIEKDASATG
jgi:hypothetical protein